MDDNKRMVCCFQRLETKRKQQFLYVSVKYAFPPSGAVFKKNPPGVLISHDVTLINNESSIFSFLSFFCFVFCLNLVDKAEVVKYPEFFHVITNGCIRDCHSQYVNFPSKTRRCCSVSKRWKLYLRNCSTLRSVDTSDNLSNLLSIFNQYPEYLIITNVLENSPERNGALVNMLMLCHFCVRHCHANSLFYFYLTVVTYCASQICIQEWPTRTKIRLLQVSILLDKLKVVKICLIKSTNRCASVRNQQLDVVLSFQARTTRKTFWTSLFDKERINTFALSLCQVSNSIKLQLLSSWSSRCFR